MPPINKNNNLNQYLQDKICISPGKASSFFIEKWTAFVFCLSLIIYNINCIVFNLSCMRQLRNVK